MKHVYSILILTTLLFSPIATYAAEEEVIGSMLLKMLWALCIVIGLILIMYGIARKKIGINNSNDGKRIKILELRPMMNRNTLALVEVEGQKILLGVSNNDIRLLTTITPKTTPESFQEILDQQP